MSRIKEFFGYLKSVDVFIKNDFPIKYWWWHLDKIIAGDLEVNIDENFVIYKDKKYFINAIQPETV